MTSNNKREKVVSVRFNLNDPNDQILYAWLKSQSGVTATVKNALTHLKQLANDQDWTSYVTNPQSQVPTATPSQTKTTSQVKVDQNGAFGINLKQPDEKKISKPNPSQQTTVNQTDEEIDNSPFGNTLSAPKPNHTNTDADGGDWRKQL